MKRSILMGFFALIFLATQANADFSGMLNDYIDYNAMWLRDQPLKNAQEHERQLSIERKKRKAVQNGYAKEPQIIKPYKEEVLFYKGDWLTGRDVREDYVRHIWSSIKEEQNLSPKASVKLLNELKATFRELDLVGVAYDQMAEYGLPKKNLATAMTYWLLAHYYVATGISATAQQYQAVYEQVKADLLSGKNALPLIDWDKHEVADSMILQATFQSLGYAEAVNNNLANKAAIMKDSQSILANLGFDVKKINLTNKGFRGRSITDR